jgi:HD-like signal output (HDOD) protein
MMKNQAMLQKIEQSAQLISLPEIYLQLRELLADPEYTMAEVALLVSRDPALATRFLRVVNSPLNRRASKIETVSHAVSLLGSRQVHDIVLGAAVAEAFDGVLIDVMSMKQFWHRSVYCAITAQQLASAVDEMETERMFVMGLLHDIGHLFMYLAIPEEAQQAILQAQERELPLYQVERELLGFDYSEVGGNMMRQWGLPKSLQMTTRFHPEPGIAGQYPLETALLHLGSLLAQSDLEAGQFGAGAFVVDESVWVTTGLTVEQCLAAQREAAEQFDAVAMSLFP